MTLRPDTLVHGRYRIGRLIGSGGFGTVYEAIDERLNHRVAIKQLTRVSERIAKQFTNEARLLANLHHSALPRVTDHFTDTDGPFLVMDYVPGDDLATMLYDRNAPFAVDEVLGLGSHLLDVLQYLHTRQPPIIHRDIKPQNLKVRADGSVLLLDFGLAKGHAGEALPSSSASSMIAFTRGFAPLEQVEGTGTDARSDLYALAATMYCLLTNTAPPEAQTRQLAVMRGRPDPLHLAHTHNPLVPAAISLVLHQAMALEKDDRPPDVPAFQAMLNVARRGDVPTERAPSVPPTALGSVPTDIALATGAEPHDELAVQYRQGVTMMGAQQWAQAFACFEAVEQRAPGYRDTRIWLAQARKMLDRTEPSNESVGNRSSQPLLPPAMVVPRRRNILPWLLLGALGVVVLVNQLPDPDQNVSQDKQTSTIMVTVPVEAIASESGDATAEVTITAMQATSTPAGTPTGTPSASSTKTVSVPASVLSKLSRPTANLRPKPCQWCGVTKGLTPDTPLTVIGRDESGEWLKVTTQDGEEGWMATEVLKPVAGIGTVPIVPTPPLPPTPIPTPAPAKTVRTATSPTTTTPTVTITPTPQKPGDPIGPYPAAPVAQSPLPVTE